MSVEEPTDAIPQSGTSQVPGASLRSAGGEAAAAGLRRRLLLGGMVGIPVSLAVMHPIKTLAKKKKKSCSYSGWHSFKLKTNVSAQPKQQTKCKGGKKSSFWYSKAKNKFPKQKKKKFGRWVVSSYSIPSNPHAGSSTTVYLYQTTTFKNLFVNNGADNTTIINCLASGTSTEGAYLTALFNAYFLNGYGYPYKYTDVYNYWTTPTALGAGVTKTQVALFFQQLNAFG